MAFDPEIGRAFGCNGEVEPLPGGEGRSLRVGDCVFKPIENEARYSWACELLLRLPAQGYRVPKPQRAGEGSFVYRGWSASAYEPGEHVGGRWREKLAVTRLLHSELARLEVAPMPPSDDRWSQAHEIAWQLDPVPDTLHPQMIDRIEGLFAHYRPLSRAEGIIHSDISGNILFDDGLDPCIIDFSPAYGPLEYAEAIMVADATAWSGAPVEIAEMLPATEHYRQCFLRAINFRVIVAALFAPTDVGWFTSECRDFEPIIAAAI